MMWNTASDLRVAWIPVVVLLALSAAAQQSPAIPSLADPSVAMVSSGSELSEALADPNKSWAIITSNINTTSDADWPVNITRTSNFTISGIPGPATSYPVLGLGYIKAKIRLDGAAALIFQYVALQGFRSSPLTQSPGFDILISSSNDAGAVVIVEDAVLSLRICVPRTISQGELMLNISRPTNLPGKQVAYANISQANCTDTNGLSAAAIAQVPYVSRCWPDVGMYGDVAVAGYDVDNFGRATPTRYSLSLLRTEFVCEAVMTEGCVQQLGPLGCYLYLFPRTPTSVPAASSPPPPAATPSPPPHAAAPPVGVSSGGSGGDSSSAVPAIVGGVVGGVGGLAVVVLVAVVALRRRQRRQQEQEEQKAAAYALDANSSAAATNGAPAGPPGASSGKQHQLASNGGAVAAGGGEGGGGSGQSSSSAPPSGGEPANGTSLSGADGLRKQHEQQGAAAKLQQQQQAARKQQQQALGGSGLGGMGPMMLPIGVGACVLSNPDMDAGSPLVIVTPFTPHRADLRLDVQCDREVTLLPIIRGKGSYGRVVEGLYEGQRVAVKLVVDVDEWSGPTEALVSSFAQEVEVLGRCCHPNVVRLLAACLTPPRLCLVMELMETSLERVIHGREELLPLPTVLHIAADIARGLAYLHPTIVHRDLKSGNVLLSNTDRVRPIAKLTDFGLSRLRSTVLVTKHPEAGTPAYMAPEAFDASNYVITHKADIYALGVIIWEMLTGLVPWEGCSMVAIAYSITVRHHRLPLSKLDAQRCPSKLRKLIHQCWDPDPQRRPAAAELVKQLTLVLQIVQSEAETAALSSGTVSSLGYGSSTINSNGTTPAVFGQPQPEGAAPHPPGVAAAAALAAGADVAAAGEQQQLLPQQQPPSAAAGAATVPTSAAVVPLTSAAAVVSPAAGVAAVGSSRGSSGTTPSAGSSEGVAANEAPLRGPS